MTVSKNIWISALKAKQKKKPDFNLAFCCAECFEKTILDVCSFVLCNRSQ